MKPALDLAMKLFPDPKEVFAFEVEEHRKYLLPLASLNISEINDNWEGVVHFIQPIEPFEDLVGEDAKEYHTFYCREVSAK
jgi:hypothetical protein